MSERTHSLIDYFLSRSNERYFSLASGDEIPDAIIIDYDHPGTATRLSQANWQQDIPLVILTTGDVDIAGAVMVRKPVDAARLENAASKALAQLIRQKQLDDAPTQNIHAAIQKDSDDTTRENLARVQAKVELMCGPFRTLEQLQEPMDSLHRFDPAKTVTGRIAAALSNKNSGFKAVQLKLPEDDIFVFPTLDKVFTSASLAISGNVKRIFQDWDDANVELITHQSSTANTIIDDINRSASIGFSSEAFLWLSTLFAARGRLPIGFDIHAPLHLSQWPNLTRLELTPDSMEITAALANGPASLPQVVEQLKCEPRHASSFVNAAMAIGVLEAQNTQ